MRRIERLVLFVVAVVGIAASSACTPQEGDAFEAVNALRDEHGVQQLDWDEGAYAKARGWSEHMADEGRLSHSVLRDGIAGEWRTLGENVAYAASVEQAMDALEASPPHRANLLNPAFTSIAIGVVERDGRVWVTQVFVG